MKPTLFDLVAPPIIPGGPLGDFVFENLGVFIAVAVALFLLSCVVIAVVAVLFFKRKKKSSTGNRDSAEKCKQDDTAV